MQFGRKTYSARVVLTEQRADRPGFHRWLAKLRVRDTEQVKSVPYALASVR
jgi:hypothetical protein